MTAWRRLFTLRWIVTTILVLAAAGVMARLGIWQLDRLEQRRAFNARVLAQIDRPEINLNLERPVAELYDMEYRPVRVRGVYDHEQEVLLRNQVWENQPGFHLLTPLIISGSEQAVLVDRGWIPFDQDENLEQYHQTGEVTVVGQIRRPQERPEIGGVPDPTLAPGQKRLNAMNIVNIQQFQKQVSSQLLPVYIQQASNPNRNGPPYSGYTLPEISEGPHFGYAIQWFSFAALLLAGYPYFVYKNLNPKQAEKEKLPVEVLSGHSSQHKNNGNGTRKKYELEENNR